jgi:hypothetical protein
MLPLNALRIAAIECRNIADESASTETKPSAELIMSVRPLNATELFRLRENYVMGQMRLRPPMLPLRRGQRHCVLWFLAQGIKRLSQPAE